METSMQTTSGQQTRSGEVGYPRILLLGDGTLGQDKIGSRCRQRAVAIRSSTEYAPQEPTDYPRHPLLRSSDATLAGITTLNRIKNILCIMFEQASGLIYRRRAVYALIRRAPYR